MNASGPRLAGAPAGDHLLGAACREIPERRPACGCDNSEHGKDVRPAAPARSEIILSEIILHADV
jgi:hypothetical protein